MIGRDPKVYNDIAWERSHRKAMFKFLGCTIEQRDRCEHMNIGGGCTINEDCNQRTAEERERKLCYISVTKRKRN